MTTTTRPLLRFTEADSAQAYREWGCNCGPAALAACLGWTLEQARPHLGDFERKGYMNPTLMGRAIVSAGFRRWESGAAAWPTHGVVRIQFGGPWLDAGVPPAAAYRATHWVASKRADGLPWVYDVNGGWMARGDWEEGVVPRLVEGIQRADGSWHRTHSWEVRRRIGELPRPGLPG